MLRIEISNRHYNGDFGVGSIFEENFNSHFKKQVIINEPIFIYCKYQFHFYWPFNAKLKPYYLLVRSSSCIGLNNSLISTSKASASLPSITIESPRCIFVLSIFER